MVGGNKAPQISFYLNSNAKETLENLFDSFYGKICTKSCGSAGKASR